MIMIWWPDSFSMRKLLQNLTQVSIWLIIIILIKIDITNIDIKKNEDVHLNGRWSFGCLRFSGSIVGGHSEFDVISYHSDHDDHDYGDEDHDDGDFRYYIIQVTLNVMLFLILVTMMIMMTEMMMMIMRF